MPADTMLTGPQKAAVLLIQLGKERGAKLLRSLREAEVETIMGEVARLQYVEPEVVDEVLDEFRQLATAQMYVGQGGVGYAREILEAPSAPRRPTRSSTGSRPRSPTCRSSSCAGPIRARSCSTSRRSTRRRSPWCSRT